MHMMYKILYLYRRNAIVYLDDVLIFSKMLAEYKAHVKSIQRALRNVYLCLCESKCVFGTLETSFVGSK